MADTPVTFDMSKAQALPPDPSQAQAPQATQAPQPPVPEGATPVTFDLSKAQALPSEPEESEDPEFVAQRSNEYKSKAWSDIVNHVEARDLHSAARSFMSLFHNPDETLERYGEDPKGLAIGAVKSVGQTTNMVSEGLSKIMPKIVRPQDVEALKKMETTEGSSEEHGALLEQLAEFMAVPEGAAEKGGVALLRSEKLAKLMPYIKMLEKNPRLLKVVKGAFNVAKMSAMVGTSAAAHNDPTQQTRGEAAYEGAKIGAAFGVGGEALGEAVSGTRKLLAKSLTDSLRPEIETVGRSQVPVRGTGMGARLAQKMVPEETMGAMARDVTGPAVAKGIGETAQDVAGTTGEINPTTYDRMGVKGVADQVKARSQGVFQKLDELSGNMLSDAQQRTEDAAGDYSVAGRQAYRKALQEQDDVFEHYRDHPEIDGSTLDQAKTDWKQQSALREIDTKLNGATEAGESEGSRYQFKQGDQLSQVVDKLVKGDKELLQRAGFSDDYVKNLEKFGRIVREQGDTPKFSGLTRAIGKILGGAIMSGHAGGGLAAFMEGAAGETMAAHAGSVLADKLIGKTLTTPKALETLTDAMSKGTDPAALVEKLKAEVSAADPSWADKMGKIVSDLYHDESGEMKIPGKEKPKSSISKVAGLGDDVVAAARGKKGKEVVAPADQYPVKIVYDKYGQPTSETDGRHRVMQAIERGDKRITVLVDRGKGAGLIETTVDPRLLAKEMGVDKESLLNTDEQQASYRAGNGAPREPVFASATEKNANASPLGDLTAGSVSNDPEKWRLKTKHWQERIKTANKVGAFKGFDIYHASEANGDLTLGSGDAFLHAVTKDNKVVGDVFYGKGSDGYLNGAVEVHPDFRRQGIASELYRKAEELTGNTFRPDLPHTKAAEAFWNNPKRPFAKGVSSVRHEAYAKALADNGGFSTHPGEASYIVAGSYPNVTKVIKGKATAEQIAAYEALPEVQKAISAKPGNGIGGWTDADGDTVLEVSQSHTDANRATALGKKNSQVSIYDRKANQELQTGGQGTMSAENAINNAPKGSSVKIMAGETPALDKKPTLEDLGRQLNVNHAKQGLEPITQGDEDYATQALARAEKLGSNELHYQLAQHESGVDWYSKDIKRFEDAAKQEHPELNDPHQMTLFKAISAGTSLGNRSEPAIANVLDAYNEFKKTGKIPLKNPATGKGFQNGSFNAYMNVFKNLQGVIDKFGPNTASEWLLEKHPVSELRQFNKNVPGKAGDMEYGALALGDKAGPFFLNMSGVKEKLTADIWWTRTWNRWMGTMLDEGEKVPDVPRNDAERKLMLEAAGNLAEKWGMDTRDAQAVLWNYEQKLYTKLGIPSEANSYGTAAETVTQRRAAARTVANPGRDVSASKK
jgi:GNAT superfamily N-acetyltransferase